MKKLVTVALLIVLFTSACQTAATPTTAPTSVVPTAPPTPTIVPALFADDFSGAQLNWEQFGVSTQLPTLADGTVHFPLNIANKATAAATGNEFPEDVIVAGDVTISSDAGSHIFGIACRYDPSLNGKAYLFYIAKYSETIDRVAGISVYDPTGQQTGKLDEQPVTGDLATATTFHLQAECIGSRLVLAINGQNLVIANDSTLPGRDAGLFAVGDGAGGEVQFDNFEVRAATADQSAAARLPTPKTP